MSVKMAAALLLLQMSGFFGSGSGGKVLVWPMEYSHWLNLKVILEELVKKGHEVTVLIPSVSLTYKVDNTSAIEFEIYPSSFSKADLEELYIELFRKCIYELPKQSFWRYFLMSQEVVWKYSDYFESLCKDIVFNKELMTKLHNSSFDIMVADPFIPCGDLLAEILKIPLVYSLCFFPGSTYGKYSGGLPLPPSYVPPALSELSDQMTFMERVQNVIYVLCFDFWFQTFNEKRWNQLYSEVLDAKIFCAFERIDLTKYIKDTKCRPARCSGLKGIGKKAFEFELDPGTRMMKGKRADHFNKKLWNEKDYAGSEKYMKDNWDQCQHLGHAKTRAFITHGGTNGIYEAIYHGIPVVGIPLFGDQFDNVVRMETKGAGVRLDFLTMSSTDLVDALKTVTNDPFYKENAMRLSRIHHDQPVKPLDTAVFWIEFVMRHKGAKHLRVAAHELTWFQYHSLDVLAFLFACVLTVMLIIMKCCLFCCRKFAKTGEKKRE